MKSFFETQAFILLFFFIAVNFLIIYFLEVDAVLCSLVISNIYSLVVVGSDKKVSYNSSHSRVPNATFPFISLTGGFGALLGIHFFRHKTSSNYLVLRIFVYLLFLGHLYLISLLHPNQTELVRGFLFSF
jgi:uncharacterized membrane protein YsdA (DUF1294 family)